jgi:U3 small nucleolar RNA-associated protein 10
LRLKALQLLNARVELAVSVGKKGGTSHGISESERELFIDNTNDDSLLTDVLKIACNSSEDTVNRETAMLSIHILAQAFCGARKAPFETVLHDVTEIAVTLTAAVTAADSSSAAATDTPAAVAKSNKRKSSKTSIEATVVAAAAVQSKQSSELTSTLGLASSTFMCLATLVALLKTKAFIKLPQYLPAMLTAIEWSVRTTTTATTDSNGDTMDTTDTTAAVALQQATVLLQQSVLSSVTAIISSLPQFLHPYMHRVLTVALQPVLLQSNSTSSYVSKLFNALVTCGMQSRLLLPCVFKVYSTRMAPVSLCKLHELIGAVMEHLERPAVIAHLDELTAFYISAMDYRRVVATVAPAAAATAVDAVDAAAIAAVMVLVLKLNENELRGLFMQLCRWKDQHVTINNTTNSSSDNTTATTTAAAATSKLHRRVTFYKLVQVMSGTLKTIFVPYFAHVLSDMKAILSILAAGSTTASESTTDDSKKRRKRQKLSKDTSATAAAAVLALSDSTGAIAHDVKQSYITVCHTITAALKNCFQYDRQSFIDATRFELIMPVLVDQLDAALLLLPNDHDDNTTTDTTSTATATVLTAATQSHAEYTEHTLAPCIAHLAAAAGKDTLWKPLVNAVLMKTRHSSAAIRLGAIQVLQKCFVICGEEFLVLIPECLPFLSELMEDSSQSVEQATRTLIKYIEDVLGESVESYLS